MEDQKGTGSVTEKQQPQEQTQGKFILKARKALSQTFKEVKEGIASLDTRVKKVPLEEITEGKVAQVVYDELRRGVKPEDIPALNIKDLLNTMGYISAFSEDYYNKFPDAYRLTRIAALQLSNQGVFEMQIADKVNSYGEGIGFIVNKDRLEQYVTDQPKKNN